MSGDYEIFKGKTLSGLFKDIYSNQRNKKAAINDLILDLKTYIKGPGYAAAIGTVIKDLIDASVKNDDALIKMASVVQRLIASENKTIGEDGFLTDREIEQLMADLEDGVVGFQESNDAQFNKLSEEVEKLKEKAKAGEFEEDNE